MIIQSDPALLVLFACRLDLLHPVSPFQVHYKLTRWGETLRLMSPYVFFLRTNNMRSFTILTRMRYFRMLYCTETWLARVWMILAHVDSWVILAIAQGSHRDSLSLSLSLSLSHTHTHTIFSPRGHKPETFFLYIITINQPIYFRLVVLTAKGNPSPPH